LVARWALNGERLDGILGDTEIHQAEERLGRAPNGVGAFGATEIEGDFPVTEAVARSTLALPFSSVMAEEQVEYVCETLKEVYHKDAEKR